MENKCKDCTHSKPLPLPMQGSRCELNRLPSACTDYKKRVENVTETPEWTEEVAETARVLTAEQLYDVFGKNKQLCNTYADALNSAMLSYKITNSKRICAFLATIGVESGRLRYTEELGNIGYFAKYEFNTPLGKRLGNKVIGDGVKFKGRGLIQITGRYNYEQVSKALGVDFTIEPHRLANLPYSVTSAAWWWQKHGLNSIADTENLKAIRKKVNGGLNGYSEFVAIYKTAQKVFI